MSHTNVGFVKQEDFSYEHIVAKRDDSNLSIVEISPKKRTRSKQRYVTVAVLTLINLINYIDRFTIAGNLKFLYNL